MTTPIPSFDPLGLALPGPLLLALSYLTLTLHFIAMQFTGGAAVLLLLTWGRRPGIARFFGTSLPLGFSYLVTFGIPPLLFVQVVYGQFFYTSSVLIGAFWIGVIPLIIVGYGAAYWHRMTRDKATRFQVLLIATTVLVVLTVGYIYVNNLTLSQRPERWLAHYRAFPAGGSLNAGEPTLHARYTLFIAPALFAAGLSLVLRASFLRRRGVTVEAEDSYRVGLRSMTAAVALQTIAIVGLWFTLPSNVKQALVRPGALGALSVAAIVCGLSAFALAYLARRRAGVGVPILAAHLFAAAVACLVVARDLVRQIYLQPYFRVDTAKVLPQWGMASAFGIVLLAGLVFLVVVTKQVVGGMIAADAASPPAQ